MRGYVVTLALISGMGGNGSMDEIYAVSGLEKEVINH
jgi:hypothetical protein